MSVYDICTYGKYSRRLRVLYLRETLLTTTARRLYPKVVLVGGASRVPKIQTNLQRTVAALGNQAQVKKTVDLDRGIAMGELLSNICTKETWSL
jgi:molecular chaperone DnaK (HSP70)